MKEYGLVEYTLTPEEQRLWINELEGAAPNLLGTMFDRDMYNTISETLKEYRARHVNQ